MRPRCVGGMEAETKGNCAMKIEMTIRARTIWTPLAVLCLVGTAHGQADKTHDSDRPSLARLIAADWNLTPAPRAVLLGAYIRSPRRELSTRADLRRSVPWEIGKILGKLAACAYIPSI
jgi:hypothetical protein